MAQQIQEIMTKKIQCVKADTSVKQIATVMRDEHIGDVLVTDPKGKLCGIVTDRDVVVRAIAEGKDLEKTRVGDICTEEVVTLQPDSSVDEAVKMMRGKAIRRIPVVRDGEPVGIVTIGDLARQKDPESALAEISAAPSNN